MTVDYFSITIAQPLKLSKKNSCGECAAFLIEGKSLQKTMWARADTPRGTRGAAAANARQASTASRRAAALIAPLFWWADASHVAPVRGTPCAGFPSSTPQWQPRTQPGAGAPHPWSDHPVPAGKHQTPTHVVMQRLRGHERNSYSLVRSLGVRAYVPRSLVCPIP